MTLVAMYLTAVVIANLTVTWWGPDWSIVNALLFIGLDLTARDKLHLQWKEHRWIKMTVLIAAGGALSWVLNTDTLRIAIASTTAFAAAGVVDTIVFHLMRQSTRQDRVTISNAASAAVDSTLFPLIAFGFPWLWVVSVGQFGAKVGGGQLWAWILFRGNKARRRLCAEPGCPGTPDARPRDLCAWHEAEREALYESVWEGHGADSGS